MSWLAARAERTPEALACRSDASAWTWAELARRSRCRAADLAAQGVGHGDVVALLLAATPRFVELLHALDGLGARILTLNLRLTETEQAFQLRRAGARFLLFDADSAERARALGASGLPARSLAVAPEPASPAERRAGAPAGAPDDPFLLLYTSGTTGRPRAACLSRRALAASADASQRLLGGSPSDRWLLCLPLHHVAGLSILVRSALSGAGVTIQPRFDAKAVSLELTRGRVSHVSLVPTQLRRLLDAGLGPGPDLRLALLGGAAASPELLGEARAAGWPVAPSYGLTEAASQVATNPPGDTAPGLAPLPGIRIGIVNEAGAPCGAGEVGEIRVQGPTLMRGYWRSPEASARALRQGWLHTGDLGRLDAAGRLHVIERRSDLIVSGGENVYPAEVEQILRAHPGVAEAAVVGVPDPEYGARPCAWLVARGAQPSESALRRHCRERLAGYKVPVRFRFLESLPRTATGKLQRARLRELGSAG